MPSPLPPWLELYPAASNTSPNSTVNANANANATFSNPSQTDNLLPFDPMSNSTPISSEMFALAIKDLPVDTLYAKAAELQNSISHLLESNVVMKEYADEGDEVCKEAIAENEVVIKRTEERIELCKTEVEQRGLIWTGHAGAEETKVNGHAVNGELEEEPVPVPRSPNGRLTDEELRRQLEVQMGNEDEDGVHL